MEYEKITEEAVYTLQEKDMPVNLKNILRSPA